MKVLVLDFDGVICDSADETARSGWLAGSFLWPEWAKHDITPDFTKNFRVLRPLLHTGFEAIAILKAIEEKYSLSFIKTNYHFLIRQIFTSSQFNFDELKAIMNKVRDDWININEQDWLSRQRIFPGIKDFISDAQKQYDHVYILTTREGKFAKRFLEYAGVDFKREYILGLETGKDKTDSLDELIDLYCPDLKVPDSEASTEISDENSKKSGKKVKTISSEMIFVDDRYLTLEKIAKDKRLENIKLYMPCWGYNFPEERYAVESEDRINLLELDDLDLLL